MRALASLSGFFLLVLILGIGLTTGYGLKSYVDSRRPIEPPRVESLGPTVERLAKLAQLVTVKVTVSDVLIGEGEGNKGAWLIKGDALIGIDVAHPEILETNDEAKTAKVRLPLPHVVNARVDHDRTRTWKVEKLSWVPFLFAGDPDALRDNVMKQAQAMVQNYAESPENIAMAKTHAEEVIRNLYAQFGWNVEVTWQDAPSRP